MAVEQNPSPAPPLPESLVNGFREHYELIREVGHGGSATVYLARDLRHDRSVAIKVMHADVGKVANERFLREIRVSASLQHPQVLPTYDSGVVDGRLFFVMPFVDGGSLRDRLNAQKMLPIPEALTIAKQIAVALSHAHEKGIIHRDVKPENIMFYHGNACLADFGIARPLEELEPGVTLHGTLVGTPGYMSPEQFLTGFDGRSDIYSLCCVLYEMIAGAKLFSGNTPQELVEKRNYIMARARESGPVLPDYIDKILDRGLARAPHHRFNDANEFVLALNEALGLTERPRRTSGERAFDALGRRKVELTLAAAVIALLVVTLYPRLREGLARPRVTLQGAPIEVSETPFETGKAAIALFDIPRAQVELAAAVQRDPANVDARLWLAESYLLGRRTGREDFRVAARQLESYRGKLHGRDSLLAEALVAFATGRPAEACRAYAAQLHRDTLDVLAWYGIGDCHSLDTTVVADKKSPSGFRFVSSYEAAARGYRRAVELAPAARAAVPFSLMTRILPVSSVSLRRGRSPDGDGFLAYPSLLGDTLAFVPYPIAMIQASAPSTIQATQPLALERNQEILLAFAREWVQAARESADAWEALALARELRGELNGGDEGAAAALQNARKLTEIPSVQLRLTAAQVRIHVKEGAFLRARSRVDSIFDANGHLGLDNESSGILAGLAALTGRLDRAAALHAASTSAQNSNQGIAPSLTAIGSKFFARAAAGTCDDSLRALRRGFDTALESYTRAERRTAARQLVIAQGAAQSFPCLGAEALDGVMPTTPLDRAQRAHAAGNVPLIRAILDSVAVTRTGLRPGDVALDFTMQEAWLRAASGDSVGAQRQLDLVLDALPTLSARTAVLLIAQSAAVGRAMALRADLAAARGDQATAKRWAKNVLELWENADASLDPTLDRMKAIAR